MNIPQSAIGSFPGSVLGPSADFGGFVPEDFIEVRWAEDPRIVEQAILKVAEYFEDMSKPLAAAALISRNDVQSHFDEERAPDGSPWAALNEQYLARKESMGLDTRILRRTGDLERAATSREAFVVAGNELFYNTSELPFYWFYNQEGTAGKVVATDVFGDISTGSTPARPFIGLSFDAEDEIFTVFDLWFAEGTRLWIKPGGQLQERLPSGRFGPGIS